MAVPDHQMAAGTGTGDTGTKANPLLVLKGVLSSGKPNTAADIPESMSREKSVESEPSKP